MCTDVDLYFLFNSYPVQVYCHFKKEKLAPIGIGLLLQTHIDLMVCSCKLETRWCDHFTPSNYSPRACSKTGVCQLLSHTRWIIPIILHFQMKTEQSHSTLPLSFLERSQRHEPAHLILSSQPTFRFLKHCFASFKS